MTIGCELKLLESPQSQYRPSWRGSSVALRLRVDIDTFEEVRMTRC